MTKVLLVLDTDEQCLDVVRRTAEGLSLDLFEAADLEATEACVALRAPDVALVAVDVVGAECSKIFAALERAAPRMPIILVGSGDWRVMAGVRALASRYHLSAVASLARPIDMEHIQRVLSTLLLKSPIILPEEIGSGMREGQFVVHYQAKAFAGGNSFQVRGVEALVRWNHPRLGLLHPASFLEAVAESNQMVQLTDYIIAESIRQAGVWRQRGLRLQLGLNISSDLVTDLELPRRLALVLSEHGVSPGDVVIDVLELANSETTDLVRDVYTQLRLLGVGLCLDNFGVGSSSITRLMGMPFTEVKVDGSLLARILEEPRADRVMACFVDLMHSLGLLACAEGVESPAAMELVRSAGFDAAQGNAIGVVSTAAEIGRALRPTELARAAG